MPHERLYSPGPTGIRKTKRLWIEPRGEQEFAIGKGKSVLLSLRHAIAANIYNLLHLRIVEKACRDDDFNCHATAAIALGESKKIAWGNAEYRGECMMIMEALSSLPFPCGMQIHDSPEFRHILHSAVLLGPSRASQALAFHKDGNQPMELCPIFDVIATYMRRYGDKPLTFYAPEPRVG